MDLMGIRRTSDADANDIAQLVNRAYRPSPAHAGWTHESALVDGDRTSPEQVSAMLAQPDSSLLVLALATKLLGCVHLQREDDAAHIGMLAVDPDAQVGGLGKRLLAAAERYAREHFRVRRYVLTVVSARAELISFYLRRGYLRMGGLADYPLDLGAGVPRVARLMIEFLEKPAIESTASA